jgi:hypothetical protein
MNEEEVIHKLLLFTYQAFVAVYISPPSPPQKKAILPSCKLIFVIIFSLQIYAQVNAGKSRIPILLRPRNFRLILLVLESFSGLLLFVSLFYF